MNHSNGRRLRRVLRFSLWGLLLVLLLACGLGLFVYLVPLNLPQLNRRVAAQLSRATGLKVDFDSARLIAAQRRFEIQNLRLSEMQTTTDTLLAIKRVELTVFPVPLLTGKRSFIDSVTVDSPSTLDLIYDEQGVAPGPKTQLLVRALNTPQLPSKGRPGFRFRSVQVRNAGVLFLERQELGGAVLHLAPPEPSKQTTVSLQLAELSMQAKADGVMQTQFVGQILAGGRSSSLQGVLEAKRGTFYDLKLHSPKAQLAQLFAELPIQLDTNGLDASVRLERQGKQMLGKLSLQAAKLNLDMPSKKVHIQDEDLGLECALNYVPKTAELKVQDARVKSRQLQASLRGQTSLRAPHGYDTQLSAQRMGDAYRDLITRFLPPTYSLKAKPESFSLDVATTGDLTHMASLVGKLGFTSVTLCSTDYQKSLENLSGEVEFAPEHLVLHNLSGTFGRANVRLEGHMEGDYLRRGEGKLSVNWQASATADDLMPLIARLPNAAKSTALAIPTSKGTIESTGSFEQLISLSAPSQSQPAVVAGNVVLRNVSFSHPDLPAPITNLHGTLNVKDNTVLIEGLHGKMLGNEALVNGVLEGERYPWRRPRLKASMSARVDLVQAAKYLPQNLQQLQSGYQVRGQVQGDITIQTDFRQLDQAELKGKLTLLDVSMKNASELMRGSLERLRGELLWDGSSLRTENLRGDLNGAPLRLSAMISDSDLSANLQSALNLEALTATFPKMQKWMEMSGPAEVNVRFAVASPAGQGATPVVATGSLRRLMPLAGSVGQRIASAVAQNKYALDGRIILGSGKTGAFMRHKAMPEAREEQGREIPRGEISQIFGVVNVAGDTLSISPERPARCWFADSKNCELDGSLQFRRNNLPKIDFNLAVNGEARLDSWIVGWGKGLPPPDDTPDTGKVFDLNGHISARRSAYRGLHAQALSFDIGCHFVQNHPRRTNIKDIRLQDEGGNLSADAWIESWRLGPPGTYPRWEVRADIRQIRIARLLAALFTEEPSMDGIMTSRLQIQGVGKERKSMNGGGSATMANLAIGRTSVIRRLGEQAGQSFERVRFETAQTASFHIANGAISTEDLHLQSRGIDLDVRGSYSLDKRIYAMMRLGLLETVLGNIPLIGELARFADRVAGRMLLAFRVSGPASDPHIELIALPLFQQ